MINIVIPTTPERKERLKECIESIHKNSGTEYNIHTYTSEGEGWVKAVHKALRGIEGLTVIVGDDMTFDKDWLKILEEEYWKEFPENDGLAQPYDEIHRGLVAVCPMADAENLRKYIHKGYTHNYSDRELTDIFQNKGKYLYVPESIVNHNHYVLGKAENDKTYESNKETYVEDRILYRQRINDNYNNNKKI